MGAPIPEDFDRAEFPIIAVHYFGLDLRNVREVFGHRLPPESDVIVIAGGLS